MEYKMMKLGDIATFVNGYAFKPNEWDTKGFPIIRIQNLNNLNQTFNYYSGDIDEKYLVTKGDILISWSASIGVFEWYREDSVLNQHIFKVNFDKIKMNTIYFKFMVSIALKRAMQYMHGSTMKHITKGYFDAIEVPVPSLEIQQKIATILDKAQSLIDKRKEQIEACDELVKSLFYVMFGDPVLNPKGWHIRDLGTLGYFKNGINYKQSDSGFNIKFFGVSEFKYGNTINNSNILPTLELQQEPNEEYLLKKGDIIFVRSNGSKELVGRSILVRELEEKTIYSGFCIRYRNQCREIIPDFLIQLFLDQNFKKSLKKDSRGANINNLNQQMLSSLKVIVPPLSLQNKFATQVEKIEQQKTLLEQSLKELENSFNSLMQMAFKGELFNGI
ncbi:restriction endonuclease subunit S [Clostridium sp. UBA7503]|uniref:restriction endonuclease subunit S n=1 Tax=Clostridium sp. UBA7503 TaxID=1946377 RepID=UPI003217E799